MGFDVVAHRQADVVIRAEDARDGLGGHLIWQGFCLGVISDRLRELRLRGGGDVAAVDDALGDGDGDKIFHDGFKVVPSSPFKPQFAEIAPNDSGSRFTHRKMGDIGTRDRLIEEGRLADGTGTFLTTTPSWAKRQSSSAPGQ